jgi:hypothetical protein
MAGVFARSVPCRWTRCRLAAALLSGFLYLASSGVAESAIVPVCVTPPAGMVSWWPGDGGASDIQGTNYGTLEGGATFGAGKVGQGFSFNGSSAFVQAPASKSLNVGTGAGLTIDLWVNPTALSIQPLVEWNAGVNTTSVGAHLWMSAVNPGDLFSNLVDASSVYHVIVSAGGVVSAGSFQHVAITYDNASGMATLYHNGTSVQATSLGAFTPQTSYDLYFATRPVGGVGQCTPFTCPIYFGGSIDEIELFNRALSAAEILAIFNAGIAGKCKDAVFHDSYEGAGLP